MVDGKTASELAEEIFYNYDFVNFTLTNKQIKRINKRLHKMVDGFHIKVHSRIWTLEAGPFWVHG